jgi:hypothetical protein
VIVVVLAVQAKLYSLGLKGGIELVVYQGGVRLQSVIGASVVALERKTDLNL